MELKISPEKVKRLRLGKSWSQEELATIAEVSLRTVQRIEIDGSASLKTRRAIAEALQVEPGTLDCEEHEESQHSSKRKSNGDTHNVTT